MTQKTHPIYFILPTFFTLFFLYLQNSTTKSYESSTFHALTHSIETRLQEYKSLFLAISEEYIKHLNPEVLNSFNNQHIYLKENAPLILGKIEILKDIKSQDLSLSLAKKISPFLKEGETGFFISKAYMDPDFIHTPILDVGYIFTLPNGEKRALFTTILVGDLLLYAPEIKINKIFLEDSSLETKGNLYPIKNLGVYFDVNPPDSNKGSLFICFLLYIISLLITKYFFLKEEIENIDQTHKTLLKKTAQEEKKTLFLRSLKIETLYQIKYKDVFEDKFNLSHLIQESLNCYQEVIKEKSLEIKIKDEHLDLTLISNQTYWRIFIYLLLEDLLASSPPSSSLSFTFEKVRKHKKISFLKLEIKDDIVFLHGFYQNFFTSSSQILNLPEINIASLIEHLNIFIEIDSSTEKGNKMTILIPQEGLFQFKKETNVISFPH